MSDLIDVSPPGQLANDSLAAARAFFYDAGTTTLRTVYSDEAETVPHPSPLLADADGLFPQVFVSGGAVKVVVQDSTGATLYTLDPAIKVAATGQGASSISFTPTIDNPATDVQTAIENAQASAASGFTPFGLGVTGSVALIANLDATNIASGQYRFDATTTGTFPTGVAAADTGAVELVRETSGSAWMRLYHDTTNRIFSRRLNASTWGAWREDITVNIGATQGDTIFRGASDWTRLAKGTAGQVLRMNSGATAPEWGSGVITLATSQATTSGTAFDFTGIPSTANRVTVMFRGVSLSGTDDLLVQLGVSGGPVTTGYFSLGERPGFTPSPTSGAVIALGVAASSFSGSMVFNKLTGNVWVWSYLGALASTLRMSYGGGDVDLGGVLTQLRITRTGTNTFDLGTVSISYE